jgi:LPS sulfotransferase NodH
MVNKRSYVVCAVQRSGSSFLCELLKSTGVAGVPEEYFLFREDGKNFEAGWWAQSFDVSTREEYISLVQNEGQTENGVFGTKLMWNYFAQVMKAFSELQAYVGLSPYAQLAAMLESPKYVWILRQDKVRQAVSWAIAAQTGIYAASQGNQADNLESLNFAFHQIKLLHRLVLEGEAGWKAFFAENNVTPFKVVYEDLVQAPRETVFAILEFLEIEYAEDLLENINPINKQATHINDEWVDEYKKLSNI